MTNWINTVTTTWRAIRQSWPINCLIWGYFSKKMFHHRACVFCLYLNRQGRTLSTYVTFLVVVSYAAHRCKPNENPNGTIEHPWYKSREKSLALSLFHGIYKEWGIDRAATMNHFDRLRFLFTSNLRAMCHYTDKAMFECEKGQESDGWEKRTEEKNPMRLKPCVAL